MRRPDTRFALVLCCFALSGFSGLLYETVWTREFSFVFGTSGLAVSTVLAAYMGGLAAGAALAARFVDRVARPVLVYGLLELGIALTALIVPSAIEATRQLHVGLLRGVTDPGSPAALALYLVASFVILGVPTTLMGATLPLLARDAVHREEEIGSRIGALYAVNTAGAVAGTLAAAFWLMPSLGLRRTVFVGASVNAAIFGLAWLLSRRGEPVDRGSSDAAEASGLVAQGGAVPGAGTADGCVRTRGVLLVIAFGAGVASFAYEVLWVRLLEHVLGGSVYAFAAMLASFLLGIAAGGALAARLARSRRGALVGLAASQLGAAVCSLAAYHAVLRLPAWLAAAEPADGFASLLRSAALAASLLLPSTLCLGAMLPFAVRAVSRSADFAAAASARVYAWNTLGAITGSLAAGFVWLPALGFEGTLLVALGLNGLLALTAWSLTGSADSRRGRLLPAALAALALLIVLAPPRVPWSLVRSVPGRQAVARTDEARDVLFYSVGRSATVLATREAGGIRIRTNGMPEAIIARHGARPGRALTSRWLGVLPALAPSAPRSMLVIGLGGSVLLESVPQSVEQIEVIELEPEVVAANRAVDAERQVDVASDPRVAIRLGDARSVLELARAPYDAIVSQPSHPWTAGSSHLYTRDFFERVRGRLAPDGVFVQWIDTGFVDVALMRSFARTITDVFPHVRLYRPRIDGLLFVASAESLELEPELAERLASGRAVDAYHRVGLDTPEVLAAALTLEDAALREIGRGARPISDDFNTMATRAPLLGRSHGPALERLLEAHDPLLGGRPGLSPHRLVEALIDSDQLARAGRFAASLPAGPARAVASGLVVLARGERAEAEAHFDAAIGSIGAADPGALELARAAHWYRLRMDLGRARARARAGELIGEAPGRFAEGSPEAIVIEAWRAQADPARSPVPLDDELASIDRGTLAYEDARAIRIAWRLVADDPGRAREALALIDERVRPWTLTQLVNRAYAAAAAGELAAAEDSLVELAAQPGHWPPALARRAQVALAGLGEANLPPRTVSALRLRIRASLARPAQARGTRDR